MKCAKKFIKTKKQRCQTINTKICAQEQNSRGFLPPKSRTRPKPQNSKTVFPPIFSIKYKDTITTCLFLIFQFQFLADRINECPAFIYINDENLNKVILDEKVFCKNEYHKPCCVREFLEGETKQIEEFKEIYYNHAEKEKLV